MLGVSLSEPGLWAAWNIVVKGTIGVAASIVLAATTSIPQVLDGLERLRVPRVIVAITAFMIRYGDVIGDEVRRMSIARESRCGRGGRFGQVRALASTAGALFVRSYERGERVYLAMESRGYTGTMPVRSVTASMQSWVRVSAVAGDGHGRRGHRVECAVNAGRALDLRDVSYTYPDGHEALRGSTSPCRKESASRCSVPTGPGRPRWSSR